MGQIAQFGLNFCKDGPLPTELGRAMNEAQELRVEGDYDAGTPSASEVAAYVVRLSSSSQRSGVLCQVPYRVRLAEVSRPASARARRPHLQPGFRHMSVFPRGFDA